jgi:hypothetical protein
MIIESLEKRLTSTMLKYLLIFLVFFQGYSQTYNYYFGNLHSHTAFSDGNKDSVSSGVNSPAGSYAYAKLSNDFDFLGISEHNHYSSSRNPGFKLPRYQEGLNMAVAANNDGNFVCMFGMEYGVSSNNNGHVIIYGFNQLLGWEVGVGGSTGPNYDIYNAKSDYAGLFKKVRNNAASFCYLAHPYWTDFTLDGTDSTSLAFAPYNVMFDSAIVGMPLRSGNAFSTFSNYSDYVTGDHFSYYKKLLNVGYHLGIGYDHDNHYTNFGRSNGGRLVVLMPSLTKANLMNSMQKMHFYGSDDPNVKIDFNLDGNIMGSILNGNQYPTLRIVHSDPDGELADTIRLWKGYRNSPSWAYTIQTVTSSNTLLFKDTQVFPGTEYYYFADIRQKDGQWIVTSPIWFKPTSTLGLPVQDIKNEFLVHQNPADGLVSISTLSELPFSVTLYDVAGKVVRCNMSSEKNLTLMIDDLGTGLYLLKVRSPEIERSFKIIKD